MADSLAALLHPSCLWGDLTLHAQNRTGVRGELQEARNVMATLKAERDALRAQLDAAQVSHSRDRVWR